MRKILKYMLSILFFILLILFFYQSFVKATTMEYTVSINEQELNNKYKYLVKGVRAENGTLGDNGCTAEFNSDTGTLILDGYSGGGIQTGHGDNLTIELIGNNKITVSDTYQAFGISNECDGTLKITSKSEANLTINVTSTENVAAGIESDYSNMYNSDCVIIDGNVNIIINAISKRNKATGIYAKSPIEINENASFNVTSKTYYSNPTYTMQSGFDITKSLKINTKGNIDLDVSKKPGAGYNYYGYGICSTGKTTILDIGIMTIKYPSKDGDAWNGSITIPENFAVNEGIVDGIKTKEIRSRSGIVHTLTLESAVNKFGKSTGQYFNGDVINIYGVSNVKGLTFKGWISSAGLIENRLAENTTYIMPNTNATVTANYSPFAVQPKFTKTGSSSGNIYYTLNEGVNESERKLVKYEETVENDFSNSHIFSDVPYQINEGTEKDQVPAGEYKIAVKYENKWYYSDIFTVNYGKTIIKDDMSDKNDESSNANDKNDTKLPQTGEEQNIFANWLLIVILIGVLWLATLLLINNKTKKNANK